MLVKSPNRLNGTSKKCYNLVQVTRNLSLVGVNNIADMLREWFHPHTQVEDRIYIYHFIKEMVCVTVS